MRNCASEIPFIDQRRRTMDSGLTLRVPRNGGAVFDRIPVPELPPRPGR